MRLTDETISRLRPSKDGRPLAILDQQTPGLYVTVWKSTAKTWSCMYKVRGAGGTRPNGRLLTGTAQRITLGSFPQISVRAARDQARKITELAQDGVDPRHERKVEAAERLTVAAACQLFLDTTLKHQRRWQSFESTARLWIIPAFGQRPLTSIRRADVHRLLDELVAQGKRGIAAEVRKHCGRLFSWALDRELIEVHPIERMLRSDLRPNMEARRALTDDEIRAVWHATGQMQAHWKNLFRLLILTGQRLDEWASAERSEIVGHQLEIPARRFKSQRDHIVPLCDDAIAIVAELPKAGYLFTTNGRTPVSGFSKARDEIRRLAGIGRFTPHDFRATARTRLTALGVREDVCEAVLGHAKQGLTRRYNKHAYLVEKRAALEAYAAHLAGIVVK
jgi:integrase